MQREELYHKTVDILVQAYFNDTLQHGYCYACAVGNLVAANLRYNIIPTEYSSDVKVWEFSRLPAWDSVFMTSRDGQKIWPDGYTGEAKREIDSTGYSWQELAKIEYAFESALKGQSEDEYMFNGLMAVIEALDEIHDNKDPEVSTKSKNRFAKV